MFVGPHLSSIRNCLLTNMSWSQKAFFELNFISMSQFSDRLGIARKFSITATGLISAHLQNVGGPSQAPICTEVQLSVRGNTVRLLIEFDIGRIDISCAALHVVER